MNSAGAVGVSPDTAGPAARRLRKLLLPAGFSAVLAGFALLPSVRRQPVLLLTFLSTATILGVWSAALYAIAARHGRTFALEAALKKQHYLQAVGQGLVFAYWGWYWPQVYESVHLIAAQLVFAYAFDMLLNWSRRDMYTLGFAPFPLVFSINLFLWFKPEWFYLQFVLVALGIAAKELIRWNKDGRQAHIFNPSSFPLAVFSIVLLATGTTNMTWGQEIAVTQFYPPQMYLFLFLIGLTGQFFFGVTTMTMSAVLTTYLFGRLYFAATGVYFFYDSYIPISVFLGMHLLFTDPATAPRTDLGRIIYGALYGLSTVALYRLLGSAGMPTFYDKLLQVPILNLSIQAIDRLARSRYLSVLDPSRLAHALQGRRRNLAYITVWAVVFAALSMVQGVGDRHPGQWLPFWRQACADGRAFACPYLADLSLGHCNRGSGWACNEAGLLHIALSRSGEDSRRLDIAGAADPLRKGCELGFDAACGNWRTLISGQDSFAAPPPTLADYPIILRGSKDEVSERDPAALLALACSQGWPGTCNL